MSTSKNIKFNFSEEFNEILMRVSLFSPEDLNSDSGIARALDVSRTAPAQWRKRGTTPFETLIDYAKKKEINIHWLLTGVGTPLLDGLDSDKQKLIEDSARSVFLDDKDAQGRVYERVKPKTQEAIRKGQYLQDKLSSLPKNDSALCEAALYELSNLENFNDERINHLIRIITHQRDKQAKSSEYQLIDPELFDYIVAALTNDSSDTTPIDNSRVAVEIYNQACEEVNKDEREKIVSRAVRVLSISRLRTNIGHNNTITPEVNEKEVNELNQNRKSEIEPKDKHSVTQAIHGSKNQVAGRDLVNKGVNKENDTRK